MEHVRQRVVDVGLQRGDPEPVAEVPLGGDQIAVLSHLDVTQLVVRLRVFGKVLGPQPGELQAFRDPGRPHHPHRQPMGEAIAGVPAQIRLEACRALAATLGEHRIRRGEEELVRGGEGTELPQ